MSVDSRETDDVVDRIRAAGQGHVLRFWDELNKDSRRKLIQQLREIDFDLLNELFENLIQAKEETKTTANLEPAEFIRLPQTPQEEESFHSARSVGEQALRDGRVAAFVVAGGQATRLGSPGPKGALPITPVKGKSFFQLFAEQITALSLRYSATIPWYIMTSETNHRQTEEFFEENRHFGLRASDIMFCRQGMIPALDRHGKLILDAKDRVFTNPTGHGGSLAALYKSGALKDMRSRGIDTLFYFQVDNVLIKICDPVFVGFHLQRRAQMSAKVASKRDAHEKVGVLVKAGDRLGVVEYSDLSDAEKSAKNADGALKFRAGNIAIHTFDVGFLEWLNDKRFRLPWHVAHKVVPSIDELGQPHRPTQPNGYKFETFVFDALTQAERTAILEVRREEEFSPVKNRDGEDSEKTAQRDMINFYGQWLERAGVSIPRDAHGNVIGRIEVSPHFAHDADELASKITPGFNFEDPLYLG
jgi:UDP-N-acetylglucosamine/UDP-N-acetylgalactosamine diphosphorylase